MPKNKPSVPSGIIVKVILCGGKLYDLPNLPAGCCVKVYDYDLEKYIKDRLELDPEGNQCAVAIWTRYPFENGKKVERIDFEVRLAIKKNKIQVVKCPKTVQVIIENKVKRK